LFRRDGDFTIVLGGNELMSSRTSGSEEALALMTIERLRDDAAPHLLLGGYGTSMRLRTLMSRAARCKLRLRIEWLARLAL
jgi:hypothetical protein